MKHFFSLMRGWPTLFILLALAGQAARAQAPAWQSAIAPTQGAGNYSTVYGTAAAANGDVYLTGIFLGTVTFGSTALTSSPGFADVFVAKWSPAANRFVWAVRAGGPGIDYATGVAVAGSSVYIVGSFNGATASFGGTTLTNPNPNASRSPSTDAYVAKLTDMGSSGAFAWALQAGGIAADVANAVAVNGSSVYVAGWFESHPATFGTLSLNNTSQNSTNAYVAKVNDAGATAGFVWAQVMGGLIGPDLAAGLAVRGAAVYVAGSFGSASAAFGSLALANAGGATGTTDAFVAKLVDAGAGSTFAWAQRAGGSANDAAGSLALNGPDLYVAGDFEGANATFGPMVLASNGGTDWFVARLTDGASSGWAWAQRGGGAGTEGVRALAAAGTAVYVGGFFQGTYTSIGSATLVNSGSSNTADLFVARFTDVGTFAWAQHAGGNGDDAAFALTAGGTNLYVAGSSTPPAAFGGFSVAAPAGMATGFLASLTDPTLTATTAAKGTLSFSLAPNPARTATTVQLPAVPGAPTATLTLTDALGRTLRTETVALPAGGLRHELRLSGLAPGLYAVQVRAGSLRGTQRLEVE
ncbi:hypothetical protein [Hymenobacter convexus]|uniref:hypothetical protein n=1 Tax=Hymenobacter sp. CA1UV-4 TaxID=3063782 RepID=UPI0027131BF1|nr:hypothetical protein [Hymenobacter sp. CA1UV-4]MDO7851203.1 hypothetical protein [Hymenobacter sp. CA1UV-4]